VTRFRRSGIGYISCRYIAGPFWTKMGIFDAVNFYHRFL
jgi:hypothetical protein